MSEIVERTIHAAGWPGLEPLHDAVTVEHVTTLGLLQGTLRFKQGHEGSNAWLSYLTKTYKTMKTPSFLTPEKSDFSTVLYKEEWL